MFCHHCGAQVSDSDAFCTSCGTALAQTAPSTPAPAAAAPGPAQAYPQQAYPQQTTPRVSLSQGLGEFKMPTLGELFVEYNREGVQYAESTGIKMKWYKAVTAAILYLSALLNTISAFLMISGRVYGSSAEAVYSIYPALRPVNILYGLVGLAFVLAALYVRMRLAQFSGDGPRLYLIFLLANIGLSAISSLLTYAIIGEIDSVRLTASLIAGIAMYFLNQVYFGKRQHLFTA